MRRLVLRRSPTGLGLNIVKTAQGPFVITAFAAGKAAALSGEIKVNDLLHAVDTTSLYDLDAAQTKALVAGTSSQLGTNVALWIQAAPNGSGTPIQAQVLAKLKNDKDALHAELANLKAEFKALQLLFPFLCSMSSASLHCLIHSNPNPFCSAIRKMHIH